MLFNKFVRLLLSFYDLLENRCFQPVCNIVGVHLVLIRLIYEAFLLKQKFDPVVELLCHNLLKRVIFVANRISIFTLLLLLCHRPLEKARESIDHGRLALAYLGLYELLPQVPFCVLLSSHTGHHILLHASELLVDPANLLVALVL